jgi:hypothetical protein
MYLVMEFCSGGDLAHYIRRYKRVSEATAHGLLSQLAAGLREMWAHNFVHVRELPEQCTSAHLKDCSLGPNLWLSVLAVSSFLTLVTFPRRAEGSQTSESSSFGQQSTGSLDDC